MSAWWLHLRNSPIRLALPVLIVLDLAVLFLRNRHWIGVWPETGAAAQVPAYLLGVVGAGAAAWAASAPARQGLREQLSSARVRPTRAEAHQLGATLTIILIPYLLGQAVAFAMTARTFPPGVHLWLGYLVLGLFVLLMSVAMGWLCGKLFAPVFAALTAALGFLLLIGLLDASAEFVVASGRPDVVVDPLSLAWRLAAILVLLLVMLWLPGSGAPRQYRRRSLVLVPVVMPLLAGLVLTDAVAARQPPGDRATCIEGATTICVWPEHEKYLPQLGEVSARIDLLPDAIVPPPRINEIGLEQTPYSGGGEPPISEGDSAPTFFIAEGSPWSYASTISIAIAASTFAYQDVEECNWRQLTPRDRHRLGAVEAWLETYLADQDTPDYQTNAPAEIQAAWTAGREVAGWDSLADQFEWAEAEVHELRGRYCSER
ncbi:hypothetical protein JQS43_23005 [Natronosporangium hydrolyticum]|uniref:Uncharacterized protein n=1 Tax=Natronosporangium hydrolyticum TaxID=2811111 RepID=A0A895YDT3_9ACTN|nr:hypothetical protein [Natronosporangium hydrolyticum]QSB14332.1 hypothetical protein JQS43_23005 [Natronosporangium hydrolyticum]